MLFLVASITNVEVKVSDVISAPRVDTSETLLELFIALAVQAREEVVVLQAVFLFTRGDVIAMIVLSTALISLRITPQVVIPVSRVSRSAPDYSFLYFDVSSANFSYHFVPGKLKLIRSSPWRSRSIDVLLDSVSFSNVVSLLNDCLDTTTCTKANKTKNLRTISNKKSNQVWRSNESLKRIYSWILINTTTQIKQVPVVGRPLANSTIVIQLCLWRTRNVWRNQSRGWNGKIYF